ncbi:MAG TPA: UbiA family prenyltransferase, partial [Bacteroidales bacterium]|nr:UbiA family prenyltransferase [Bacteroidales bacterium]
ALTAHFHYLPLLYSLAVLCWVSGFDIIYALSDMNFDKQHGLHSIPERFCLTSSLVISLLLHIVCLMVIIIAGIANHQGIFFWTGAGIFAFLLFYQHYIVKPNDLSRINFAFFTLNGISGLVLLFFFLLDFFLAT